MIPTTDVNWEDFQYKWKRNPQKAFEELTYLLFCQQFNQKTGIFRYINQPYIETDPISVNGKKYGFQSKWYALGTHMSEKKNELIRAVKGAVSSYPDIKTLIFYTHPEFGSSNKKDDIKPKFQKEIENVAHNLGIEIEWCGPSNIEAQLMLNPHNNVLRDEFFQVDSVVRKSLTKLERHKNGLLSNIQTRINFQENTIFLDINELPMDEFLPSPKQILMVEGEAGAGKSALVKQALSAMDDSAVLAFSSTDLDVKDKNRFLDGYGSLDLDDILEIFQEEEKRIVFIDAVEKYFVFEYPQTFEEIVTDFINAGWKMIFTIRTEYVESFRSVLRMVQKVMSYHVNLINRDKLSELSVTFGFAIPKDRDLVNLLFIPFYFEMYLNLEDTDGSAKITLNQSSFEEKIWEDIVRENGRRKDNMPARREEMLINLTMQMLWDEAYFYEIKGSDDYDALLALERDGILSQTDDTRYYYFSHDVFEELVAKYIFLKQYQKHVNGRAFFDRFRPTLRTRKLFQTWLSEFVLIKEHQEVITMILNAEDIEQIWKDEVLITVVRTEQLSDNLWVLLTKYAGNHDENLKRVAFIINACCREADYANLYLDKGLLFPFRMAKPVGYAWQVLFEYIDAKKEQLDWDENMLSCIIDVLYSWTENRDNFKTDTTAIAGRIGLHFLMNISYDQKRRCLAKGRQIEKLYDVILRSAWMITNELEVLFQNVLDDTVEERNTHFIQENNSEKVPGLYFELVKRAVSDLFHCGNVPFAMPQTTSMLMKKLWYNDPEKTPISSINMENYFGFNEYVSRKYYPANAFMTPIIEMLRSGEKNTTNFLLELCNRAGECYKSSRLNIDYNESEYITLFIENTEIEQIASARLWNMYWDESNGSHLLASLLMGMERWLLGEAKNGEKDTLVEYCRYLLTHSHNVMLTAIVVSIAEAYPDKMIDIVCDLIKTKEIFRYDTGRLVSQTAFSPLPVWNALFREERRESNTLPHRKVSLEEVVFNYQVNDGKCSVKTVKERQSLVFDAIDVATTNLDSWDHADKFPYYRMDSRCYQDVIDIKEDGKGHKVVTLGVGFSKDMEEHRELVKSEDDRLWQHVELELWSDYKFNRDDKYKGYSKYNDISVVIEELCEIWQQTQSNDAEYRSEDDPNTFLMRRYRKTALYVSSVLLRDFREDLAEEGISLCKNIILVIGYAFMNASDYIKAQTYLEADVMANGIVCLIKEENEKAENAENLMFLLLKLTLEIYRYEAQIIRKIANVIWEQSEQIGWKLIYLFSLFADRYEKEVIMNRTISNDDFWNLYKGEFLAGLKIDKVSVANLNFELITPQAIFAISLLTPTHTEEAAEIARATKGVTFMLAFSDNNKMYDDAQKLGEYTLDYVWWLAELLLYCKDADRDDLVGSFVEMADMSKNSNVEYFLDIFIESQKTYSKKDEFWYVWELLKKKMIELCYDDGDSFSQSDVPTGKAAVVATYLFANTTWDKSESGYDLLSKDRAKFFESFIINEAKNLKILFFVFAKLLNSNGRGPYQEEGISWIARLVERDPHCEVNFYRDTLYNLEEYIGRFVAFHQNEFKKNADLSRKIQNILDYLFQQGSQVVFFIREQI